MPTITLTITDAKGRSASATTPDEISDMIAAFRGILVTHGYTYGTVDQFVPDPNGEEWAYLSEVNPNAANE